MNGSMFVNLKHRLKKRQGKLDYSQLERRQLLAGQLQFSGDVSVQTELVVNGGFQILNVEPGARGRVESDNIAGWFREDESAGGEIKLYKIETPRDRVLVFNASSANNDYVIQNVFTEVGKSYQLLFDMRGRSADGNVDPATNAVELFWDGTSLGQFNGDSFWQTFSVDLAQTTSTRVRLELRHVGAKASNGLGPAIDNVRLLELGDNEAVNGSFEALVGAGSSSPTGWSPMGQADDPTIDVLSGQLASEGSRFINLDSSSTHVDRIYQDIATVAGQRYLLSFDIRAASGTTGVSEEVRVRWNDEFAGIFRGGPDWQSVSVVVEASSDMTRLVFREPPVGPNNAGDGAGPQVDNVKLQRVIFADDLSIDVGSKTKTFPAQSSPIAIADDLIINGASDSLQVSAAMVELSAVPNGAAELLDVSTAGNSAVSVDYDPSAGILTVSGNQGLKEYERILKSLTYENTSATPATQARNIAISIVTQSGQSARQVVTVFTSLENDAPRIEPLANATIEVGEMFTRQVTASDNGSSADLVYSLAFDGDAVLTGDSQPSINGDGLISWTPARRQSRNYGFRSGR